MLDQAAQHEGEQPAPILTRAATSTAPILALKGGSTSAAASATSALKASSGRSESAAISGADRHLSTVTADRSGQFAVAYRSASDP